MTASESTAAATSDVVVAGLSLHEEFNPWSSLPATIEPPVAAHLREWTSCSTKATGSCVLTARLGSWSTPRTRLPTSWFRRTSTDQRLSMAVHLLSSANLLLAELRVTASFECYASACEVLLAAVASYAGSASEAFATRHAWSSDALHCEGVQRLPSKLAPEREWRTFFGDEIVQ